MLQAMWIDKFNEIKNNIIIKPLGKYKKQLMELIFIKYWILPTIKIKYTQHHKKVSSFGILIQCKCLQIYKRIMEQLNVLKYYRQPMKKGKAKVNNTVNLFL